MYPLPPKDELSHLVGSELTQIIIDPYLVRFLLSGPGVNAGITIESPFLYRESDMEDRFEPDQGCSTQPPVRFHALLRQRLTALDVTPEGDRLSLQFEGGQELMIWSEIGGPYESGSINDDGKQWIF